MEIPSPPLSHSEETIDPDSLLNMNMDYLSPLSFIGLDNQSWSQQSGSDTDPNNSLDMVPFGVSEETGFQYDFSFGNDMLGLPSPPNSNTSLDPPSPFSGFNLEGMQGIALDPAMTSNSQTMAPSYEGPAMSVDSNAPTGTKRGQRSDNSRPKTSHTTIERRYRTNLNTRMTGLREAVPALRVLDKNIPTPTGLPDIIDDRGYVDGVKAAKKNSKSTILGKATEYITVLKRREGRLRGELHALKMLVVATVPDGPNLVATWEANHQAQFGGEQSDELLPQDTIDEDDEEEEEGPRPAKKIKTKNPEPVKTETKKLPTPAPIGPNGEPLKRKRGRPRKVPVPAPDLSADTVNMPVGESQFSVLPQTPVVPQPQPARYLLAAFAFFSLFGNIPLPKSSYAPSHDGTVLNQLPATVPNSSHSWINDDLVKVVQLVTSLLLLVSILAPHLPVSLKSSKFMRVLTITDVLAVGPTVPSNLDLTKEREENEPKTCEPTNDVAALRIDSRWKTLKEIARHISSSHHSNGISASWRRLARDLVMTGREISLQGNLRTYYALSSIPRAEPERALLAYSVYPNTAGRMWGRLQETDNELRKFAFRKTIEETLNALANSKIHYEDPLKVDLATVLAQNELLAHMDAEVKHIFSAHVLGNSCQDEEDAKGSNSIRSYRQALKFEPDVLGPDFALLLNAIDDLESPSPVFPDLSSMNVVGPLASIRDILLATQLFARLFPVHTPSKSSNTPLSPPPSPTDVRNRQHAKRKHELRCLLGRDTFEQSSVDRARDVVVDMLTRV